MKKIPLRRCLGCFESKPKNELCRVVKTTDGEIILDKTGKKNGRGAYICHNVDCFNKAKKSKKIEKVFETQLTEDIYNELEEMFKE